jgi:aspartokinase-like uncharacterized kinase
MPLRVVKVGGSLLEWPLLGGALCAWLAEQPAAMNVLVCGGGTLCDAIRRADAVHHLGEATSHWLCVDALTITAQLLAAILGDIPVVETVDRSSRGAVILDPRRLLLEQERRLPGRVLPHNWSVTSDSIAARLAEVLEADELVLLKSADPPPGALEQWAAASYVDSHFPRSAANRTVRAVNLRSGRSAIVAAERPAHQRKV